MAVTTVRHFVRLYFTLLVIWASYACSHLQLSISSGLRFSLSYWSLGARIRFNSRYLIVSNRTHKWYLWSNIYCAILSLEKPASNTASHRTTLFLRPNIPSQELWDGPRTGPHRAPVIFGVDQAQDINSFGAHLTQLLPHYDHVFVDTTKRPGASKRKALFGSLSSSPLSGPLDLDGAMSQANWSRVRPLASEIHQMRKIKSESEIAIMKRAASISANAHTRARSFLALPPLSVSNSNST